MDVKSLLNDEPLGSRRAKPQFSRSFSYSSTSSRGTGYSADSLLSKMPHLSRDNSCDSQSSHSPLTPTTPLSAHFGLDKCPGDPSEASETRLRPLVASPSSLSTHTPASTSMEHYPTPSQTYMSDMMFPPPSFPELQAQVQLPLDYHHQNPASPKFALPPPPHPKKNSYPCPFSRQYACREFFTTSGHAARHAKKHTGRKDAVCPECNKAFTRKDNMEQHRRTHSGVRSASKPQAQRETDESRQRKVVKPQQQQHRKSNSHSHSHSQSQSHSHHPSLIGPVQTTSDASTSPSTSDFASLTPSSKSVNTNMELGLGLDLGLGVGLGPGMPLDPRLQEDSAQTSYPASSSYSPSSFAANSGGAGLSPTPTSANRPHLHRSSFTESLHYRLPPSSPSSLAKMTPSSNSSLSAELLQMQMTMQMDMQMHSQEIAQEMAQAQQQQQQSLSLAPALDALALAAATRQ